MHKYLMAIRHYFRGWENFIMEADSKTEALEKSKIYVRQSPIYSCGGNYDLLDVKCVKKLQDKQKRGKL